MQATLIRVCLLFTLLTVIEAATAQQPVPVLNAGFKIHFRPSETFRGTQIYRQKDNLAYAYVTDHAAADADGAPNAYHPGDLNKSCRDPHIGLDCLANAGYPNAS